jgi:hypothetical protein
MSIIKIIKITIIIKASRAAVMVKEKPRAGAD